MIFATGSTYSQGDARPGLDGSRHGGVVIGLAIIAGWIFVFISNLC